MSTSYRLSLIALTLALLLVLAPGLLTATETGQTIPTRTPTPGAITPTPPGGGGEPTATQLPPQPTETDEPGATDAPDSTATVTATVIVTLPPTPVGGIYPTAAACSPQPTAQALSGRVNVRGGPGLEYEQVGELQFLEVRPIIGRSGDGPWWQITLADAMIGWVADAFVQVQGYTGQVPVVAHPALPNGAIPTAGVGWDPTPNPACTPPPTFTPTSRASATTMPTATEPATVSAAAVAGDSATGEAPQASEDILPSATIASPATATAVPPPTAVLTAPTGGSEEPAIPTAAPLDTDSAGGSSAALLGWLPVIGAGLVVTGVALFFVRRR